MKPTISSQYDHDPRHWRFERQLRQPLKRPDPDYMVWKAMLLIACLVALLMFTGVIR